MCMLDRLCNLHVIYLSVVETSLSSSGILASLLTPKKRSLSHSFFGTQILCLGLAGLLSKLPVNLAQWGLIP